MKIPFLKIHLLPKKALSIVPNFEGSSVCRWVSPDFLGSCTTGFHRLVTPIGLGFYKEKSCDFHGAVIFTDNKIVVVSTEDILTNNRGVAERVLVNRYEDWKQTNS